MTDVELESVAKTLPDFRGVFMRDSFARMKPRKNECAIVNLDSSRGPGTHWCAYRKRGNRVWWYDSFADLEPPLELRQYFAGSSILYNFVPEQKLGTVVCGHLCLDFLIKTA